MKKTMGIVLAAIAMFVWGAVFWMVLYPQDTILRSTDDALAQAAITNYFPKPGVYVLPAEDFESEAFKRMHEQGPIARVEVSEGRPPMAPSVFVKGFVHQLITVFLIALLLGMAALESYRNRLLFVLVAGLAASFYFHFGEVIWFYSPVRYQTTGFIYDLVAWLVAGVVLAYFFKPAR